LGAAGAIAKLYLQKQGIMIRAAVTSIGDIDVNIPIEKFDWQLQKRIWYDVRMQRLQNACKN
jgi:chorismate synthase